MGGGGVGATNGLKGGDSSFGTVIAPGGEGGGKVGVTNTNGGNGGAPNTGDVRIIGGHGGDGQSGNISVSGEGGSSFWGAVVAQALAVALSVGHMVRAAVVHTMPVIAEPV